MGIIEANEILKERYEVLKLSVMFRNIVGNLPASEQWAMLLHGIQTQTKTARSSLF